MHLRVVYFLIFSAVAFNGCATMFQGSTKEMEFTSEPSGAMVYIDNEPIQQTPFSFLLKRDGEHTIRFHKENYLDRSFIIRSETESGWVFLDLFIFYGLFVDAATGAWNNWDYNYIHGVLDKK